MIVVVSDLHFQDAAGSGPPEGVDSHLGPAAFEHLWRQIEILAERCRPRDPITVVLNGDIVDLLRSEQWLESGARPYNFDGPPDEATLRTAGAIAASVLARNAPAIAALAGPGGARFVVVYGNHDRLLRHEALEPARAALAHRLGGATFVDEFCDERHRLAAHHGHELDWANSEYQLARAFEGLDGADPARRLLAPLGDWVALDIGTRAPHLAWTMLESGDARWRALPPEVKRDVYVRLVDLDDLRPQAEVLRWLVRPAGPTELGASPAERPVIERFLGDLMNALVVDAMPRIEPWLDAHRRPVLDRLAIAALTLLGSTTYTATSIPALVERIQRYLNARDDPWAIAPRVPSFREAEHRFFATGHTHVPGVMPLRREPRLLWAADDDTRWYVNTGTWRKTIVRSTVGQEEVFGAVKQLAFAVFHDAEETYHLTGRLDASFDLWQGASSRF